MSNAEAVRFATPDALEQYNAGPTLKAALVSRRVALEETLFLGLRLSCGVNLRTVAAEFGDEALAGLREAIAEFVEDGLLSRDGDSIRLSVRGRLLSNEVFQRFISLNTVVVP